MTMPIDLGDSPVRILIADDEGMLRAGLRAILDVDFDVEVVAEASNGTQTVERAQQSRPEIVLLDLRMPDSDGLEAAAGLAEHCPDARTILLAAADDRGYVVPAMAAGVAGIVPKAGDAAGLLRAIRAVVSGGVHVAPPMAKAVLADWREHGGQVRADALARLRELPGAEKDLLLLVAEGYADAQIARDRRTFEGNVAEDVAALLSTLGLRHRIEALVLAADAGLTVPRP